MPCSSWKALPVLAVLPRTIICRFRIARSTTRKRIFQGSLLCRDHRVRPRMPQSTCTAKAMILLIPLTQTAETRVPLACSSSAFLPGISKFWKSIQNMHRETWFSGADNLFRAGASLKIEVDLLSSVSCPCCSIRRIHLRRYTWRRASEGEKLYRVS